MGIERKAVPIKMDETPRWFLGWCAEQTGHKVSSMGNNFAWAMYRLFINGHVSLSFIATQGRNRVASYTEQSFPPGGQSGKEAALPPSFEGNNATQGRFTFFNRLRMYRAAEAVAAAYRPLPSWAGFRPVFAAQFSRRGA